MSENYVIPAGAVLVQSQPGKKPQTLCIIMQHSKGTFAVRFLAETYNKQDFKMRPATKCFHTFDVFLPPETNTVNFTKISRRNRRLLEGCPHFPHSAQRSSVNRVSFRQIAGEGKQTARVIPNIR